MDSYAVLSDIHGNRWALEAVVSDALRREAQHLLNLGDILYGPLDPEGTAELLMNLDVPTTTICGNEDRILFEPHADPVRHSSLEYTLANLSTGTLGWLRSFPAREQFGSVLLTHGTPEDDEQYLLERVDESGARTRDSDEVEGMLPATDIDLVLCGHSHLPRCIQIPGGPLVVNPGSVGLPAYSDDSPFPHAMEAGSRHARYGIVEKREVGWIIELIILPYDWERAAKTAEKNGKLDWAHSLRTGRANSNQ